MRAWLALVVPIWVALILCAAWEPVMHDGWDHASWFEDNALSPGALLEMIEANYHWGNPRLGQTFTHVLYAPGPVHAIVTPLLVLSTIALLLTLVLGRWPSVRRADDAVCALLVTGALLVCVPQIGPLLVYRPFVGNYTFGFALSLLWLVPYRLHLSSPSGKRWWLAPTMLALGALAGACNEHTGLAFLGLGIAACIASWRRPPGLRVWMIIGLVGFAIGYVLLLLAPGQDVRYGGLAKQAGILERILDRGWGNATIVGMLFVYLLPTAPLVAAALWSRTPVAREVVHVLAALAVAGVTCQIVVLASPKIGPRLYFAAIALCSASLARAAHLRAVGRVRVALAAAATIAVGFVCVRLVMTYSAVAGPGAERYEMVRRAPRDTVVDVPGLGLGASRYFIGDELDNRPTRYLGIGYGVTIRLRPRDTHQEDPR